MKSLRLTIILAALGILAASSYSLAQEWGPEIQVTNSLADDRNAAVAFDGIYVWVFWDREVSGEKQIFYRIKNVDGQWIQNEEQLTFGPGTNSHPITSPNYFGPPMAVCWEHGTAPNRDVQLAYRFVNTWSSIYSVFSLTGDEYNPSISLARDYQVWHYVYFIIITAQTDNSVVVKHYIEFADTLSLFERFM